MQNSFITNYAEYADIQHYMKNNFVANYTDYADFEYQTYFYQWLRWL